MKNTQFIVFWSLLLVSSVAFGEEKDIKGLNMKAYCQQFDLIAQNDIRTFQRFEQSLQNSHKKLITHSYPQRMFSSLFDVFNQFSTDVLPSQVESCDVLNEYPAFKKLVKTGSIIKHSTLPYDIAKIGFLDASLLAHALITDDRQFFEYVLNQIVDVSPTFTKEVFFLLVYDGMSNNTIKKAMNKHKGWFKGIRKVLISEADGATPTHYLYQTVLQRYFEEKKLALASFRQAANLDGATKSHKHSKQFSNVLNWLVWHRPTISPDYYYQYWDVIDMHYDNSSEFVATPELAEKIINDVVSKYDLEN